MTPHAHRRESRRGWSFDAGSRVQRVSYRILLNRRPTGLRLTFLTRYPCQRVSAHTLSRDFTVTVCPLDSS
jgi:hypothetical protein